MTSRPGSSSSVSVRALDRAKAPVKIGRLSCPHAGTLGRSPSARAPYDGTMDSTGPRSVGVRALRDGLVLAGLLFGGYLFIVVAPGAGTFGFDAFAYWHVDIADPYGAATAGGLGAFTYTPVVARLFDPFGGFGWLDFLWLWTALQIGVLVCLGRTHWRTTLALLAFPPVALEIYHGNIHLLMATAVVLGFRYPAAWWFILLTKVTPGVGLLWFAVRREWRSLAIALGGVAILTGVSVVVDPETWQGWLASVSATAGGSPLNQFSVPVPLPIRLVAAAVVVIWGARTDRRWTVLVAVTLGLPVLWLSGLAVLAALPWTLRRP